MSDSEVGALVDLLGMHGGSPGEVISAVESYRRRFGEDVSDVGAAPPKG